MFINFFKNHKYILVYLWLAFLICVGFFRPGYLLTLDMYFVPDPRLPESCSLHTCLYSYFLFYSSYLIPTWVFQKILIFGLFVGMGVFMHRFFPLNSQKAKYFAGLLYMINPFVYTRLFAGQHLLLVAYALLPLYVKILIDFLKKKTWRNAVKLSILLALIPIFSLHIFTMAIFVSLVLFVVELIRQKREFLKGLFLKSAFVAAAFSAASFYWILPFFTKSAAISSMTAIDQTAFASAKDPVLGLFFNILAMYGFWEEQNPWAETVLWPKNIVPFWYLFFVLIFCSVIYGVYSGLKKKKYRKHVLIFSVIAIFAFIFSVGVSDPVFRPINNFVYDNIPLFKGFRDSQKWSVLLVFSYCILGGIGLQNIIAKVRENWVNYISYFIYGVIIVYTCTMFGGFMGQLRPVWYPNSWYEVNNILNGDNSNFKVLFLPWHMYLSFEFNNNRLVSNPAEDFFDKEIIQGDNMEMEGLYSSSTRESSLKVQEFLASDYNDALLRTLLQNLKTKYIIYVQDLETIEDIDYSFLEKSSLLTQIYEEEEIVLYKFAE